MRNLYETNHRVFPHNFSQRFSAEILKQLNILSTPLKNQGINFISFSSIRLSFYLGKPNRHGISVIYARFYFQNKEYRISTGLKVLKINWQTRCNYAKIGEGMSKLEIENNTSINKSLRDLEIAFINKIDYFCNHIDSGTNLCQALMKTINPDYKMPRRKKSDLPDIPFTKLLERYRMSHAEGRSDRSLSTMRTNIRNFRKFLEEEKIPDTKESMQGKEIFFLYSKWLKKQKNTISISNDRIRALATNFRIYSSDPTNKFECDIPDKLPLIAETIKPEERKKNKIALSEAQINQLWGLVGLTDEENIARDMFCMQCWTGIRFEDIPQILNSKNLKIIDGKPFSIFYPSKTERKSQEAHVPLDFFYPHAIEIVKKYLDNPPISILNQNGNQYNKLIKSLCCRAKFNDVITHTKDKGTGKISEEKPLWKRVTSHVGRHSFATNLNKRGISEDDRAQMMGLSSPVQIRKTYDNTDSETKASLLNKRLLAKNKKDKSSVSKEVPPINNNLDSQAKDAVELLCKAADQLGIVIIPKGTTVNLRELSKEFSALRKEIITTDGEEEYQKLKSALQFGKTQEERELLSKYFCTLIKNRPFPSSPIEVICYDQAVDFWKQRDFIEAEEKKNEFER